MTICEAYTPTMVVLGKGGTSLVLEWRGKGGVRIAAKRMSAESTVLKQELAVLQTLTNNRHDNVITYHGNVIEPPHHYILLELAPMGDLFEHVVNGDIEKDTCRLYFIQMARAVEHLHFLGIAHCDVKLENFVLFETSASTRPKRQRVAHGECAGGLLGGETVKLLDFGFARVCNQSSGGEYEEVLPLHGHTAQYASPEALAGTIGSVFLADVYSLGVCLFSLWFGVHPMDKASEDNECFVGLRAAQRGGTSTVRAWFAFHWHHISKLHKNADTDPLACDLIDDMLAFDPQKRSPLRSVVASQWLKER